MAKAVKKTAGKTATKTAKKAASKSVKLGDPAKTAEQIDIEINDFLREINDFTENSKKAAAGRARKHAQAAIQFLRLVRKEIQNKKNNL
jgi:hypothetical protein